MYKVLIIDDEILIAKGLQAKMDWKKLGCEVCSIATDGLEGQRLVEELKPDIVISDIIMPGMTGLELSGFIHTHYPSIITIILTAYEDFKYAQQAIRLGVKEYIVKPIDKKEMFLAVSGAVSLLRQRQSIRSDASRLHNLEVEVKPIMNSTILLNIALNGDSEIEALGDKLGLFDLNIGKVAAIVFELEPEHGKERNRLHSFALKNAIQSTFERHGCSCDLKEIDKVFVALVHFEDSLISSVISSRLKDAGDEICRLVSDSTGLKVSAGVGRVSRSIQDIHASYVEAREALKKRFFAHSPGLFTLQDSTVTPGVPSKELLDTSRLRQLVGEGDTEQALALLRMILDGWRQTGDRKLLLDAAAGMLKQLNSLIHTGEGTAASMLLTLEKSEDTYSFASVKQALEQAVEYVCKHISGQASSGGNKVIRKVERMIREKYGDKGFSLQVAADELGISLSYLSRLFKKETDFNFMEYLTEVRIHEAQKLLHSTDLKNNEIANKVGFYDVGYFSQVFRKKCDMTPSEYKQRAAVQKIK